MYPWTIDAKIVKDDNQNESIRILTVTVSYPSFEPFQTKWPSANGVTVTLKVTNHHPNVSVPTHFYIDVSNSSTVYFPQLTCGSSLSTSWVLRCNKTLYNCNEHSTASIVAEGIINSYVPFTPSSESVIYNGYSYVDVIGADFALKF